MEHFVGIFVVVVGGGAGSIGIDVVNKPPPDKKIKNVNFNREKVFEKP